MVPFFLAVVALLIVGPATAQNYAISILETLPDVVAPCVKTPATFLCGPRFHHCISMCRGAVRFVTALSGSFRCEQTNDTQFGCFQCEVMPSGTCSDGFPNICSYICAESLVPFWNSCDVTTQIMPDDYFADEHGFLISGVRDAVQSCRQVS